MSIASYNMDPSAVRVFTIDWSQWPFRGAHIASIAWKVPPEFAIVDRSIIGFLSSIKLKYIGVFIERDFVVECHMITSEPGNDPCQDTRRFGIRISPR